MQVWTPKTIYLAALGTVFAAVLSYGLIGGLIGSILRAFSAAPPFNPLWALVAPVPGVIVGILYSVRYARRRVGTGVRVLDRPLPHGHADTRIAERPAAVPLTRSPPRQLSLLPGRRSPITAVALSPDGRLALSAAKDNTVSLWDLQTGVESRALQSFSAYTDAVAFSPDARLLAAGGAYFRRRRRRGGGSGRRFGGVYVWDAESGELLRQITFLGVCSALAFHPDGREIVAGGEDYLRVWELEGPTATMLLQVAEGLTNDEDVLAVAVSADGNYALIGCQFKQDLRLIHLGRAQEVRRFAGHSKRFRLIRPAAVVSVAISPDGRRALSGSWDQTARVWDLQIGQQLACFEGHRRSPGWWRGVVGVAWLGNERAISVSENGLLCVWDAATAREITRHDHGAGVACLAAARDGRVVVTGGSDGILRVWDC
jgi:WD40 repeat protein